jgi:hypothetical protein
MADLAKDPKGWELEDFIAAYFVSSGYYVETGVTERNPDDILELDIVRTDYREEPEQRYPVEVKSGGWGLGDVFKFYGWTRYLGLPPGEFVHKETCGHADPASLQHIQHKTQITLLHIPTPEDAETRFKSIGVPKPYREDLPQLWRFSFWAQRRLLKALSEAVRKNVCPETAKAAKRYHRLVNDALFFIPDTRDRVGELLSAHFKHQELGASAAYELETGSPAFANPPNTRTFERATYRGKHFPVQACLYLAHRARLSVLKAVVDYWLARERGTIKKMTLKLGQTLVDMTAGQLTKAMADGADVLSTAKSFRMFPVFWQVFLWSWGGFLLEDRLDEEYADLERETGVCRDEIPLALQAFDKLFPTKGGWFRKPGSDSRSVLMLTPAAMRGIGAFRRLARRGVESYKELGYTDLTTSHLAEDNNTAARLLDSSEMDLTT